MKHAQSRIAYKMFKKPQENGFLWTSCCIFTLGLNNNDFQTSNYRVFNGRMITELERIWKETVMA
jgi:hypothetical protein